LGLIEDDGALGINAGGDEGGRDFARGPAQGIGLLPDRDGMHVDHAIEGLVRILQGHEAANGAEIIAQMQIAGRLDAGKDARRKGHGSFIALRAARKSSIRCRRDWELSAASAQGGEKPTEALRAADMDEGEVENDAIGDEDEEDAPLPPE